MVLDLYISLDDQRTAFKITIKSFVTYNHYFIYFSAPDELEIGASILLRNVSVQAEDVL